LSPPPAPPAEPGAAPAPPLRLADLRGLRSSPTLDGPQRQALRQELLQVLPPFPWFTLGVMAPSAAAAIACLRRWERALGWSPLAGEEVGVGDEGPVFLKGNQRSGTFLVRREEGLGEGVLISGQDSTDPTAGQTWGPLPLDLF